MAEKYRRPTPKSQRELSEGLQTPYDAKIGNPNDAADNKQFPPDNQANIPFNRSNQMSFKNDTTKPFTVGLNCLLYTSPSPRDRTRSRMPSSA